MTTSHNITSECKNLWCRDARGQAVIRILGFNPFYEEPGARVRSCRFGDQCKGAHSIDEFRSISYINKWFYLDKSTFNFPQLQYEIISAINAEKSKIREVHGFTNRINRISEMNFIDQIQLWHDLACFYRKIAKQIPSRKDWKSSSYPETHSSGYTFSHEVPQFYISDKMEDYAWAFERLTRYCKKHSDFKDKVAKKQKVTIWDMCLGEMNCKEGIHHHNDKLCVDDFLTGKCNCISKLDFENQSNSLKSQIDDLQYKINNDKNYKRKEALKITLQQLKSQFNNLDRMIHYSDYGMIPFNQQQKSFIDKLVENKVEKDQIHERNKPNWDHDFVRHYDTMKVGKVIKLTIKR